MKLPFIRNQQRLRFTIFLILEEQDSLDLQERINTTIVSVQNQKYPNWEICRIDPTNQPDKDGCGQEHPFFIMQREIDRYLQSTKPEYLVFLRAGDQLHPQALSKARRVILQKQADLIYTDECVGAKEYRKPDFSMDRLRAYEYLGGLLIVSGKVAQSVAFKGVSCHYDRVIQMAECAKHIEHIRECLYLRGDYGSRAEMSGTELDAQGIWEAQIQAGQQAVLASIQRSGMQARISLVKGQTQANAVYHRIHYEITDTPKVSILIPNKDHVMELSRCLDSIYEKTTYPNYEIIIIENNSTESDTFAYYEQLKKRQNSKVCVWGQGQAFNYAAINNYAASKAQGEYLILLNNDTEVITPEWIEEMLMYAQRPDVGAVGAKLLFSNDTIQHVGVVLGIGKHKVAGHSYVGKPANFSGENDCLLYPTNVSAVTGACLMVRKSDYLSVGGMTEELAVSYNDVDFCMKLLRNGLVQVITPYACLYHHESASRGSDMTGQKKRRLNQEARFMRRKWKRALKQDRFATARNKYSFHIPKIVLKLAFVKEDRNK